MTAIERAELALSRASGNSRFHADVKATAVIIDYIAQAINEAEERGRVEMREKCAQVARYEWEVARASHTPVSGGLNAAHTIEDKIRALSTTSQPVGGPEELEG